MDAHLLWRYVHILGVVLFVGGHGVSVAVTVRLGRERDPARLATLLDLSRSTIVWSNVGLLVLVVGGVANWISVDYPRQGWLWASVALLAALAAAGVAVAAPHFRRIRRALAERDGATLERLLASRVPLVVLVVETLGLAAIVWLMVYRPF